MSYSVRPHRLQPTRLPHPWDSPGKNTGVGFHFLLQCMKVKSESEVAQLCPTLSDPIDCSLPGSSVHGIFQARVLEWIAISFSRRSSQPRDRTQVSWKQTLYHLSHQGSPKYKFRLYLTRENYVAELIDKWTSLLSLVFWFLLLVNLISYNDLRKFTFVLFSSNDCVELVLVQLWFQ